MTSAGNDIVALSDINIARTEQPKFYSKIITPSEKEIFERSIAGHLSLANFVWLLWSVKEAAYKFLQRLMPGLIFSPSKIIIGYISIPLYPVMIPFAGTQTEGTGFGEAIAYSGTVVFGQHQLYFKTLVYQQFIASVVNNTDNFEQIGWGIKWIADPSAASQSEIVREFLLNRLSSVFAGANLHIVKSEHGYPVIFQADTLIPAPVSLAHHDHWIAYSFQLGM